MQAMIARSIVPVLLLIGGVGLFVYGTWFHDVEVTQDVIKEVEEEESYERGITLREKLQEQLNHPNWLVADQARQLLDTLPDEDLADVVDSVLDTRLVTKKRTDTNTSQIREPELNREMAQGGNISLAESGGLMRPVLDTTKPPEPDAGASGICET